MEYSEYNFNLEMLLKRYKQKSAGFTLVELLVTISMFVIVTGVVLVNSNKFSSTILLNNFAYDVALTIKQAQSFGVNVREGVSGSFNYPYGVYFNTETSVGKTSFILFNDTTGPSGPNNTYDGLMTSCPTDSLECIQRYTMTRGTYIKSICTGLDEINCQSVNNLSVLFKRPDPTALIYSGNPLSGPQSYAKIILSAADGATSTVVVTSVGQIYVKK